jgi:hypothetical protein
MEQHRTNPSCASCHAQMDPLGFALENFDAIGRWRTLSESHEPIDSSAALPDGTTVDGVVGLRNVLLSPPLDKEFARTVVARMLTYALGRGAEASDQPAIRAILREAAPGNLTLQSLVAGMVNSVPFQMRRSQPRASAAAAASPAQ